MKMNADNITAVIAIAAIISPVFVTIVNNFFTYKLKKSETQFKIEQFNKENLSKTTKLVSDFISSANALNTYEQTGGWQLKAVARNQFAQAGASLLPYLSPAYQKVMQHWLIFSQVGDKNGWNQITKDINKEASNLLNDVKNNY